MNKLKKIKRRIKIEWYNALYTLLYFFKMRINDIKGYDCYEYEFRVRCNNCKWVGFEEELISGYYDAYNGSNDSYCCPDCGAEMN